MKNSGLLLILTLITVLLPAQVSEVGVGVGYGKTVVDDSRAVWVLPFGTEGADFLRFGFGYSYTPRNAVFAFKTGINYDRKSSNDIRLNYLRIPAGIDFSFGKKVCFIAGAGLFAGYLIAYSGIAPDSDFENTAGRLQFGWQADAGIGVRLTPEYRLVLSYGQNFDITKMYEESRYSPGGAPYTIDEKGFDGFIRLCVMHLLKPRKR